MIGYTHAVVPRIKLQPLIGRHAVVTGGGRSIGRAISMELAALGADLTIGYDNDEESANETAESASRLGRLVAVRRISHTLTMTPVFTELDCDILVNNAGISRGRSVGNMNINEWDETFEVNLTGAMVMTKTVVGGMIERGWGRIINIASVVGMDGRLGPSSYAASKAGLIGFTKAIAHELAAKGITANAVAPGFIDDTGMLAAVHDKFKFLIQEQIPMRRYGRVEDVAQAVGYLVQAEYVTGTVLNVSGGYLT